MSGSEIDKLINEISKLPSIGRKSAQRIALYLLKDKEKSLLPLVKTMQEAGSNHFPIRFMFYCPTRKTLRQPKNKLLAIFYRVVSIPQGIFCNFRTGRIFEYILVTIIKSNNKFFFALIYKEIL